ncbi:hypothetical protein BDV3_000749 [Batrachochytrium dendrobatidis]|nr:hypothetical protein O5D80_000651 [Batrachochytrium dendrobatidis]KAK5672206.1 hypothetical protein QVD99_002009 [Batrachochytrium dendrobatidis]
MRGIKPCASRTHLPSTEIWAPLDSQTPMSSSALNSTVSFNEAYTASVPSLATNIPMATMYCPESLASTYPLPRKNPVINKLTIKIPKAKLQSDQMVTNLDDQHLQLLSGSTIASDDTYMPFDTDIEMQSIHATPTLPNPMTMPLISPTSTDSIQTPTGMMPSVFSFSPSSLLTTQRSRKELLSRLQRRYRVLDLYRGSIIANGEISMSLDSPSGSILSAGAFPAAAMKINLARIERFDPVLNLKYFYLYLDYAVHDPEEETPRHQLAQFAGISEHETIKELNISLIPCIRFPILQTLFARSNHSVEFYLLRVDLDMFLLHHGEFKNILIFESKRTMQIECTTSVYSFGKRILETIQPQTPELSPVSTWLYQFDYVKEFFTAFLNGFQFLEGEEEARMAIENLSIMQTFEEVDVDTTHRSLISCISYEFQCGGSGNVEMFRLQGE